MNLLTLLNFPAKKLPIVAARGLLLFGLVANLVAASLPEDLSARAEALDGGCPRRRLDSNQHIFQCFADVLDYTCVFRRYYPLNYGTFYIFIPLWLAVVIAQRGSVPRSSKNERSVFHGCSLIFKLLSCTVSFPTSPVTMPDPYCAFVFRGRDTHVTSVLPMVSFV